jgi:hypothetical protein
VDTSLNNFLFILQDPRNVLVQMFALKGEQHDAAKQTPDG